jgi:hypothetical protein
MFDILTNNPLSRELHTQWRWRNFQEEKALANDILQDLAQTTPDSQKAPVTLSSPARTQRHLAPFHIRRGDIIVTSDHIYAYARQQGIRLEDQQERESILNYVYLLPVAPEVAFFIPGVRPVPFLTKITTVPNLWEVLFGLNQQQQLRDVYVHATSVL